MKHHSFSVIHYCVLLGVACAAAVLTGALLVGDSMRGSLRNLTLDRLGSVDTVLFAPNFIDYHSDTTSAKSGRPVIYLQGSAEYNGNISGTQILAGVTVPASWDASFIVNQALADKLQLKDGGELSLRLLSPQSIPPESSFGKKDNLIRTKIMVDTVITNRGIGRFSLKADQQAEPLLIVPLDWLQTRLEVGDKINAVFYKEPPVMSAVKPTLNDLGINVNGQYITSKRMLFTDEQADVIKSGAGCVGGLLYLATSIKAVKNGHEMPYSTLFAVDNDELRITNNEITLNQWAADDLQVQPGDEIELTWFSPDNVNETKQQKFILAKIVPNDTFTNDVVPDVKGFTDEKSIADWDPPFPFDAKKIRKVDEDYWDKYRAAPKAFVDLETGQKLWGSRFGKVSTFIIANHELQIADEDYAAFNLNFVPVKQLGLAASQGTTPFSVLFLCFSFFIIASALMLVAMLFRLSIEMQAKNIGIRLACGWTPL
ncbi:MAG: hypothetical protein LBN39_10130, partial [Planctomycetaceae bacterium]|nr:hypothetical protein [Planctomycetaceae bacterium]